MEDCEPVFRVQTYSSTLDRAHWFFMADSSMGARSGESGFKVRAQLNSDFGNHHFKGTLCYVEITLKMISKQYVILLYE